MFQVARSKRVMSRRDMLRIGAAGASVLVGVPLLAACGPAATPSATPAPAKPVEKPAEKPAAAAPTATTAPAPKPAEPSPTQGAPGTRPAAGATKPAEAATPAAKPAAQTGQTVTLNFQHFFTGVLWTNGFQQLVEMFEKQNPNIKWTGFAVPYGEMMPKLITLAAGGQPPDGTSLDNERIKSVIFRGLLKELDPYAQTDKTLDMNDFYRARLESYADKGKHYALPIDMGSGAVYYNKEMFDEAGLKYPDPKWTYQDILDTALKLTVDKNGKRAGEAGFDRSNVKQWGYQFPAAQYRFYNCYHGFNGAEYFDKEITKTRFNEPEAIASMQWFADLRNKHFVSPSPAQDQAMRAGGVQPFTSGGWAMEHTWIGLIAYLHQTGVKVQKWDVVNLPETPTAAQETGGQGFVVINGAKQPDAAWAWARFMAGDDAQKYMGTNGVWFPVRKSMAKFGLPSDGKPEGFFRGFYEQVDKHGQANWWYVPGWEQWSQAIQNELDPMWLGGRDVKATAAAIQEKVDPMVKDWEKKIQ